MENWKGIYGLPQAGLLTNQRLTTHLAKYDYAPNRHTPGLWRHKHRPVTFSVVVDNFGVKYEGRENAQNIISALEDLYKVTTDWGGEIYIGITLKWNYKECYVNLSMTGYVEAALKKFQHLMPR